MKKEGKTAEAFILFICALVLIISVSCASAAVKPAELTAGDAAYALTVAMQTAVINASSNLDAYLHNTGFIPPEYWNIETYRAQIPGMNTILEQWRSCVCGLFSESLSSFTDLNYLLAGSMPYEDPVLMVESGSRSGTELFVRLYADRVTQAVKSTAERLDPALLIQAAEHYNTWVRVSRKSEDFNASLLGIPESGMLEEYVTNLIADTWFSMLSDAEDLFRTTPDPYGDSRISEVFGNK